jgi:Tol biopolymer transport system component
VPRSLIVAGILVTAVLIAVVAVEIAHGSRSETASLTLLPGSNADVLRIEGTTDHPLLGSFALAPSGRDLVVVTANRPGDLSSLWLRSVDGVQARPLAGTGGAAMPFWSPDGRAVGFFAGGLLKTIAVATGHIDTLAQAPRGRGGTWGPDGTILFAPDVSSPIVAVNERGGPVTPVTDRGGDSSHRFPWFLPGGREFLYLAQRPDRELSEIRWGRLGGRDGGDVATSASNAMFTNGFLVFALRDVLVAQRFDQATKRLTSAPAIVRSPASIYGEDGPTGLGAFSVSASSVLAIGDVWRPLSRLAWLNRKGQAVRQIGPPAIFESFDLSRDGARVVGSRFDPQRRQSDLYVIDLRTGLPTQLTDDPPPEANPLWSPDGRRVAYGSLRDGQWSIFIRDLDRERPDLRLTADCGELTAWLPDGGGVICGGTTPAGPAIVRVPLDPNRSVTPIAPGLWNLPYGRVSPNGDWLAFGADRDGHREVFVVNLAAGSASAPQSLGRGDLPRWHPNGRELFFVSEQALYSVQVPATALGRFGTRKLQFHVPPWQGDLQDSLILPNPYDVSPDGSAFVFAVPVEDTPRSLIRISHLPPAR